MKRIPLTLVLYINVTTISYENENIKKFYFFYKKMLNKIISI